MTPKTSPTSAIDLIALRRLEVDQNSAAVPPQGQGTLSIPAPQLQNPSSLGPLPLRPSSRIEALPMPVFATLAGFLEPYELAALSQDSRTTHAGTREALRQTADPEVRLANEYHQGLSALAMNSLVATPVAPSATDRMNDLRKASHRSGLKAFDNVHASFERRKADQQRNSDRPGNLARAALRIERDFAIGTDPAGCQMRAAVLNMELGRADKALEAFQRFVQLSPLPADAQFEDRFAQTELLLHYQANARQFDAVMVTCEIAMQQLRVDLSMSPAAAGRLQFLLGDALLRLGAPDAARTVLDKMAPRGTSYWLLKSRLAHAEGNEQECAVAAREYSSLLAPFDAGERDAFLVLLWGAVGDVDRALPCLERAVQGGNFGIIHDPLLDTLRGNEYFQMMQRRLHMTPAELAEVSFDPDSMARRT